MGSRDTHRRSLIESTDGGALQNTATDGSDADGSERQYSRRGYVRGAVASGLALGGLSLGGSAAAAARQRLKFADAGDYSADEGVDMAVYKAQTSRDAAVDLFYEKAQYLLGQLHDDGIISGWRVALYDTDRDSVDNNKGEDWGAYDVGRIFEDEGWTSEDLGLWFTERAKIWDEATSSYEWQQVGGGSAGWQTAFDPDGTSEIAPAWMSTDNPDDRVVAHGASMETMHALVDGGLSPIEDCHGGHGEHSLGNAIYEYNEDYGESGFYGSPIAAGPHTWNQGSCAAGVEAKHGITFTLSHCTERAVEHTMDDRLPDRSLGSGDGTCGRPAYLRNEHVVTIEGTESGWTSYSLTVGDTLEKSTAYNASINDHDEITTTSEFDARRADGKTWEGRDSYRYRGRIMEFTCEDFGAINVYVDGEEVYPRSIDGDVAVIDGAGTDGWTEYDLEVTAGLEKSTADGASINDHDDVNGTHADGWVYNGKDAYSYYGGVETADTNLPEGDLYFL